MNGEPRRVEVELERVSFEVVRFEHREIARLLDRQEAARILKIDEEERPTLTLFPAPLAQMYEARPIPLDGYLVRTAEGNFFSHRNFYRDFWETSRGAGERGR